MPCAERFSDCSLPQTVQVRVDAAALAGSEEVDAALGPRWDVIGGQAHGPLRFGLPSGCMVHWTPAPESATSPVWIGQFLQADGKPSKDTAKIAKRTIHGWTVTTVDVSGAYTGMAGPTAQPGPAMGGYRMLGAIVEGPQGSIFFKFTGPAKTIAANQAAFDKMLESMAPVR
jgi:hypothetical protein